MLVKIIFRDENYLWLLVEQSYVYLTAAVKVSSLAKIVRSLISDVDISVLTEFFSCFRNAY